MAAIVRVEKKQYDTWVNHKRQLENQRSYIKARTANLPIKGSTSSPFFTPVLQGERVARCGLSRLRVDL
jgi:hypothetical protein